MKKIGNWIGVFLLVSFLLAGQAATPARATGTIRYVAPGGIVSGTCNSWAHACHLQYALATVAVSGDQLWVKQGTYKPTTSTGRTYSFMLRNGIKIYGGFAGTETKLPQRNPKMHVTILSGDIGTLGHNTDNSYHVVNASGVTSSAVLDGFTISGGNANGSHPNDVGGGIFDNNNGNPTFNNLTLKGNSANYGGGIYNFGSSPTLTNVTFQANSATNYGGGMDDEGSSSPKLMNVTFSGNSTLGSGGGIANSNGSRPKLTNVTFSGNSAYSGGGIFDSASGPILTDVTFHGNSAVLGGGIFDTISASNLANVTFQGNSATFGGGMANLNSSNPTLTNVTFSGNSATTEGGGMYNTSSSSPKLTNVTFNGNKVPGGDGGGMENDNSNPTLINVTFQGNSADLGGGIYNHESGSVSLKNATFSGNNASTDGGAILNYISASDISNSVFWNNNNEIISSSSTVTIEDSLVAGGCPLGATCSNPPINSNPLLGPLAYNGGLTRTMALAVGSPAIDAGGVITTCAPKDQRGVKRPQGPHCDMGAYEAPVTVFLRSIGAQDGSILESGENTNMGGSLNSSALNLILGDDATRKQYRGVLSFNTSVLPDNAAISSIKLKLKPISVSPSGSNPVLLLQGFMLDVKKGFFGSSSALQVGDFQASSTKTVGPFSPTLSSGVYTINLNSTAFASVNKLATNGGLTQIRVRFKLDDNNNNIANILSVFSGNNSTPAIRPTLTIVYTTP